MNVQSKKSSSPPQADTEELLRLMRGADCPEPEQFRRLVTTLDSYQVLAKVFLLEGTPFVFKKSPMKYIIFKEQVADRFGIGSQDVCIVGSARLGFSPSPHKYGQSFTDKSDVDVVVISDELFDLGTQRLFRYTNSFEPSLHDVRPHTWDTSLPNPPQVPLNSWRIVKEATRNFVYQNLNPALLPFEDDFRQDIFEKISSTAGLFLALDPQVFVSKIRCRVFRTWRAAEDYYSNSLRELSRALRGETIPDILDEDDVDEAKGE